MLLIFYKMFFKDGQTQIQKIKKKIKKKKSNKKPQKKIQKK
jgi:hypothetical protein